MEKYKMILAAEAQFAREVTLGIIVQRPVSAWSTMIPGMFLFDYLRREGAVKKYSRTFMFPRRLAMNAALADLNDEDKISVQDHIQMEIRARLESLNLQSDNLLEAQVRMVELLADYYTKLLNAEGDTYLILIENAYPLRDELAGFFDQLLAVEKEVDHEIVAVKGADQVLQERLAAEQQQVAKRRQKILDDIF